MDSAQTPRRFHRQRRSGLNPAVQQQPTGNQQFQPLAPATGPPPYHLRLEDVLPLERIEGFRTAGEMSFHVAGDVGGVTDPRPQQAVADALEDDCEGQERVPAFLYLLGDVVYYFGEGGNYYSQFYRPYEHYPGPIFAIPGNHDGEVVAGAIAPRSLDAFVENFCATSPHVSRDAGDVPRDTMTQPNVYWTLEGPLITIVGLYSNVPEGGQLDQNQTEWLVNELRGAPQDRALAVAVHHAPYSLDSFHAGSEYIGRTLDGAFASAGRVPDIVLSGHVHNYQRFTRHMEGGRELPYIVAGSGGFWHLNTMQPRPDGEGPAQVPLEVPGANKLVLERYGDDGYGYLRFTVTRDTLTGWYFAASSPRARLVDSFQVDLGKHSLATPG